MQCKYFLTQFLCGAGTYGQLTWTYWCKYSHFSLTLLRTVHYVTGLLGFTHSSVPLFTLWRGSNMWGCWRQAGSVMMNDLFKKELTEGLMTWIWCWKSTPTARRPSLTFLALFSSRLYRAACFGNLGSDILGCWHSKGSTPKSVFPSFSVSQRFGKWTEPFYRPSPVCSGGKHGQLVLAGTGDEWEHYFGSWLFGWSEGLPLNAAFF